MFQGMQSSIFLSLKSAKNIDKPNPDMASLDCVLPAICKIIFSFHYFKIFLPRFKLFVVQQV